MTKSEKLLRAVVAEIEAGKYPIGSHLPTHRAFAKTNGVSLAVVNRVYEDLRRRGLVETGRRRGTVVKATHSTAPARSSVVDDAGVIDLSHNYPMMPEVAAELRAGIRDALAAGQFTLPDVPSESSLKTAGEAWFRYLGLGTPGREIHCALGAQHGLIAVLMLLRPRTGHIFLDHYTYAGMRLAARALELSLVPVEMDIKGMLPSALKSAIQRHGRGIIYLMPALHNPMAVSMTNERTRDIAKLASTHDCPVIEDDTYRYLAIDPPAPIAEVFPTGTFSISTLSKIYGPQVQLGFVAAPAAMSSQLSASLRSCAWGVTSPTASVVADWIASSRFTSHVEAIRSRAARFRTAIEAAFPGDALSPSSGAFFVWLRLPDWWTNGGFVEAARRSGVVVLGDEQFCVTFARPKFIRFSAFTTAGASRLADGIAAVSAVYKTDQTNLIRVA